jgi:hypothetical protein
MEKATPVLWLLVGTAIALLAGCMQPLLGDGDALSPHVWKDLAQSVGLAPQMCGTPTVVTLFAGQTINAGTVAVTNDAMNL